VTRRFLIGQDARLPETVLIRAAAVLMVASGVIHVYLWHVAYRHVATLGPLFLVQAVSALVLAVLLATTRRGLFVLAAFGLMAGTIIGFVLVTSVGLFGFTLTFISGWAKLALATESATILILVSGATLLWRSCRVTGSRT
jgi:hypothetical protein